MYLTYPTDSTADTTYFSCGFVLLVDSTRTAIDSCCLNANHEYEFFDVAPGEYKIVVVCAKRYSGLYSTCVDYSWSGDTGAIVTGGGYMRVDVALEDHDDSSTGGCCHDCPCYYVSE